MRKTARAPAKDVRMSSRHHQHADRRCWLLDTLVMPRSQSLSLNLLKDILLYQKSGKSLDSFRKEA